MKKIIIGIISLLLIGGIVFGVFYFKDKNNSKEEDKEVIFGDNQAVDNSELEKFEDLIYSVVGNYFSTEAPKITELDLNQKILLSDLTDEQIFYASYRASYAFDKVTANDTNESEENYFTNGYSSSIEYIININDIKSYAKNIYKKEALDYLPDEFIDSLQKYTKVNDTYVGRTIVSGIEEIGYEYNISNISAKDNEYSIVLSASSRINDVTTNCDSEDCEGPVIVEPFEYKIIFNKTGENYEFVSLERTK